mmetsp:Transcript_4315/g.18385  ORF Transcript_4315/g.18385 Transcript_4315/m.18385 type:complete len:403 (-) Transcript_4315:1328-2536(-)|eukprot:CAMPEP_0113955088 /NCGR_PEP_ID=MMETSP0011_2-20120614/1058_1 /TAXON_ID=101924 /ORGANISM="Rhodosorus marinus" /LENGTH=402 /DNA_ID=CAMNT_0000964577 /DNA_START=190 /DNA_END=1398 /DNA_ORIENTATION=- /assembly_acc=CAM_ASM_000156
MGDIGKQALTFTVSNAVWEGRHGDRGVCRMMPNVYWRSVPMEDLRKHPQFRQLPELSASTGVPSDPAELANLRQDSKQWDMAHQNRLTSRFVPAVLGFFEEETAKDLQIPLSLKGHEKALGAFEDLLKFSDNEVELEDVRIAVEDDAIDCSLWKIRHPNEQGGFPYEYHPESFVPPADAQQNQVMSLRMKWGKVHEPVSILAAVNYFSEMGAQVKEAGLHCVEVHHKNVCEAYGIEGSNCLPKIGSSPDGVVDWGNGKVEALEAKNHCPFFFDRSQNKVIVRSHGPFFEVGTWYIAQLMWHMLCVGPDCESAILTSMGIDGVVMHRIQRDEELIRLMLKYVNLFFKNYVRENNAPPENFFHNEPDHHRMIFLSIKAAHEAQTVATIVGNKVQRSPQNLDFFL